MDGSIDRYIDGLIYRYIDGLMDIDGLIDR